MSHSEELLHYSAGDSGIATGHGEQERQDSGTEDTTAGAEIP